MKTKILLFVLVLVCIMSCGKHDEESKEPEGLWYTSSSGSYMDAFVKPDCMTLSFIKDLTDARILIDLSGSKAAVYYTYSPVKEEDFDTYKAYSNFYGDSVYHHAHTMEHSAEGCLMPLKGISVVADQDFDENHLAGMELNDLFTISYSRFYQYIKSGYKPVYGLNAFALDSISELSAIKDVNLFSVRSTLIFKKKPESGKYKFTISFDFGDDPLTGESFSLPPSSIEVEF